MADSKVEFEIKHVKRFMAALDRLEKGLTKEGAAALYQEGLSIQTQSMMNTPVLTGALRASHDTERPTVGGGGWVVRIKVGGPAIPYALKVHEDMGAKHKVGGAKYLERAMTAAKRGLSQRLAARVRAKIGRV